MFRLLGYYVAAWVILVIAGGLFAFGVPDALAAAFDDLTKLETIRNLLSYMLGAQVTMVGLIFPLALAMVTLIAQRDEGAATNVDVQLYYDQSFAYTVGTSGIALGVSLIAALIGPEALVLDLLGRPFVAGSITLSLLLIQAAWLLANLLVMWQFLITSLSFITPSFRAERRKRFVAARIIPHHLAGVLAENRYVRIDDNLSLGADRPMPFIMAGAAEGARGENEVVLHARSQRQFRDVRLTPLRLAVMLWAWRCRRSQPRPVANKSDWMLGLIGGLDRRVRGEVVLCRRKGGIPMIFVERWLIRAAFVFGRPIDASKLGPSDVLEELADRVIAQIDRLAVTGFDHALTEMRGFHGFLLRAYTIIDAQGVPESYAAYGTAFAEHANWIREYRRLYERAIAVVERDDSFIGSLAFLPANLVPSPRDHVPPAIVASLYELPQYMVHRIGHWLTAQRSPRGTGLAALIPGALPPVVAKIYRSVVYRIVGANESALQAGVRYAKVPHGADHKLAWATMAGSWPILFKHLETAAYLIAASHWHEDDIAVEPYVDSFLQWRETLGRGEDGEHFAHILQTSFLSSDLVDLAWEDVASQIAPDLVRPDLREALPAPVFAAVIANLHADMRVILALLLAGWASGTPVIYGASTTAKRLASNVATRGNPPVMDLVRTYLRLRMIEWSVDSSAYVARLDNVVRAFDGMTEGERIAGRVYSVETRFRVGALKSDWFAMVAALSDAKAAGAVGQWIGELGNDTMAARLGEALLFQLHAWLLRTAALWTEPATKSGLAQAIERLDPVLSSAAAGDALHAALVAAAVAIDGHRVRRLAAQPIAPGALAAIGAAAEAELHGLRTRIGLFPGMRVSVAAGAGRRRTCSMTKVDKALLVDSPMTAQDMLFPARFANHVAAIAAGAVWRPYSRLARRRFTVRTTQEMFAKAAEIGAAIAATGARAIALLPTDGGDWPDFFDARRELGDAVTQRAGDDVSRTYLYSYADVDFHRSGLPQVEILPDDLLEQVTIFAPEGQSPVAIAAKPEADPTEITVFAKFAVEAIWRAREVVVLRRGRRT